MNSGKCDHGFFSSRQLSVTKHRKLYQLCSPSLLLLELSRRGQCALAFLGMQETCPDLCFYLENAELPGKFDEEGCSCINVLFPGDLNAFSEQGRRTRDQGYNGQGSNSADHTQIF